MLYLNTSTSGPITQTSQAGNYDNNYASLNQTNITTTSLSNESNTNITNTTTQNQTKLQTLSLSSQNYNPSISFVSLDQATHTVDLTGSGFALNPSNLYFYVYPYSSVTPPPPSTNSGSLQEGTLNNQNVNSNGDFTSQITLDSSLTKYPYYLAISEEVSSGSFLTSTVSFYNTNYVIVSPTPTISAVYNPGPDTISVTGSGFTSDNSVIVSYEIVSTATSGGSIAGAPNVYGTTTVTSDNTGAISATLPVYKTSSSYIAIISAYNTATKVYSNKINLKITAKQATALSLGTYEIAVLRVYNNTYFNDSPTLPGSSGISCSSLSSSSSSCQNQWNTEWENYWNKIISTGNGQVRQVGNIKLDFNDVVNPSSNFRAYNLYNISLDYQGDIFISSSETFGGATNSLIMKYQNQNAVSPTAKTLNTLYCTSITCLVPVFNYKDGAAAGDIFTEIATSPNGGQVYLASPAFGQIYVYNGNDLTYSSAINLGYSYGGQSSTAAPSTSSSSSSATTSSVASLASLNIYYWLSNGGLFGKTMPTLINANTQTNYDNDRNAFHRPLAIQDINGYLYVLDNWAGILGTQTNGKIEESSLFSSPNNGIYFNILTLRVINSTGYDVPIEPSQFNDMYQQFGCSMTSKYTSGSDTSSSCYYTPPSDLCVQPPISSGQFCAAYPVTTYLSNLECLGSTIYNFQSQYHYTCLNLGSMSNVYYQTASANLYPSNTYPPYGWILSANVSTLNDGTITNVYNVYSANERSNIGTYTSQEGYYPLGPAMPGISCSGHISTSCTIPQTSRVGFSINFNNTVAILTNGGPSSSSTSPFGYSELLISRFNIFNYTKIGGGINFVCYSSSMLGQCIYTPQLLGTSTAGGSTASSLLYPPIYLSNNPFNYYESLGAQKVFQYANNLYSTYSGGKGSAQSAANSNYNQNCINEVTNGLEPTGCINNYPSSLALTNILNGVSPATVALEVPPAVPILESSISGFSIIPYEYQQSMQESWTNFQLVAGFMWCPPSLPPIYYADSNTKYGYVETPLVTSGNLDAPIEGGKTYLSYENTYDSGYYVPNLSDVGVYLNPQIFFNISSNRLFGSAYINVTQNQNTNKQFVLNATQQLNYITSFTKIGSDMLVEAISSTPVNKVGSANAVNLNSPQTEPIATGIQYTPTLLGPPGFGTITLFNWYQQIVYESPIKLFINGSYGTLPYGYHRLIYVLQDRFNNTIFVPIDADIARLTTINLTINPVIDPANSNQTTINIQGTAGYYTTNALGYNFNPLSNGFVYLYYGQNINYNGINAKQSGNNGAFDAEQCAFGVSGKPGYPSSCVLADPLNTEQAQSGNIITYAPQVTNNGICQPPQQSIVNIQSFSCNIYSNALCPTGADGQSQYCYPENNNGDGVCTSQLGLMAIEQTNSLGQFSFNTIACGIGQQQILAKYYGYPGPEPVTAQQSYLPSSANPSTNQPSATFNVYTYSWMPNQTISSTQIGLFELSYGTLGLFGIILVIVIIIAMLILTHKLSKKKQKNRKTNKNSNRRKNTRKIQKR